jgi:hypothetical protein
MWVRFTKSALMLLGSLAASAALAGNWNAQTHDIYAGRFNNDSRTDLLVIAKDPSGMSGIFVTDGSGNPSIEHQSWDSKFLGIDWSGGHYAAIVGNFDGVNGDDVLLQRSGDGPSYLLLSAPDGRLLTIDQPLNG